MKKRQIAIIMTAIILFLAVIIILPNTIFTVAEDEFALVMRFSKIEKTIATAGIQFKVPFIDEVTTFPKNIQVYDIPPSEVLTADKQNMSVDSYLIWKIDDPVLFYKTLGTLVVAEGRLDVNTYNAFKNYMGRLQQNEVINQQDASERNDIYKSITDDVAAVSAPYGISVIDVKIKRIDLPELNEQAVYTRMISERSQMSEKYIADGEKEAAVIRNDVDRKVKIIISDAEAAAAAIAADGEATYMQMLAAAYNSDDKKNFYEFILALEALEASLTGDETTIILDANSVIGKILISP